MNEASPEIDSRMEANIRYLKDFLKGVFGIECQDGSRSADASGDGYSAAVEEHPSESKIYICGKHDGGDEFEAWVNTADGACSENFNEVLDLVFPN